jgi:uncharacterized membrane protein YheB (UPF0754 family)
MVYLGEYAMPKLHKNGLFPNRRSRLNTSLADVANGQITSGKVPTDKVKAEGFTAS